MGGQGEVGPERHYQRLMITNNNQHPAIGDLTRHGPKARRIFCCTECWVGEGNGFALFFIAAPEKMFASRAAA